MTSCSQGRRANQAALRPARSFLSRMLCGPCGGRQGKLVLGAIGSAAGSVVVKLGPADGDVEGLASAGFHFTAMIVGDAGQEQKGQ